MTTTSPVQTHSPAEQAHALLAYAADEHHFYTSYADGHPSLHKHDAATAMYAAQAATALLAVVGELAELRAGLQQAAAMGEDIADIASGVRELTAALKPLEEIAGSVDGLTDQVEAVRDEVEDGLAAVASEVELLVGRRRSRWWSWLRWPVRRWRAQRALPSVADVRKRLIAAAAPTNWLSDALARAADLLESEGWAPCVGVMDAVGRVAISPEAPYAAHVLCVQAREAIVAHLGGPLSQWETEFGRTQGQVVAMLREVAAKVTASELVRGRCDR
ncbi:hypothetical protein [Nonomuraea polychroma]|nr:hypothetical protein [Nonomuraea polychroma]